MTATSSLNAPSAAERYVSGNYLESTGGTWHLEDAPFKATQIRKMLDRNAIPIRRICEIGCGVGGILAELHGSLPEDLEFVGYEVSPQAHALSLPFRKPRLQFYLGDCFERPETFDLALVMDVVEHVEDCFDFLRRVRRKSKWQIYHLPLEISCLSAVRDNFLPSWRSVGHIHRFSHLTALEALRYTGHEILDAFLTPGALSQGRGWKTQLANVVRRLMPMKLAARVCGGFSLLALTKSGEVTDVASN